MARRRRRQQRRQRLRRRGLQVVRKQLLQSIGTCQWSGVCEM